MNRFQTIALVALASVAISAVAFFQLRHANQRLELQLRTVRAQHETVARQQRDNAALRRIVDHAQTDADGARRELGDAVDRAHREITDLEQKAQQQYEAKLAASHAAEERLAENRDLTKGPVLVEHCGNVGRATAVDAFQTLVWASVRGDDEAVAQLIAVNGTAREMIEAVLAGLPESERAKYPTPERFVALYVADNVTNVAAVHVTKQAQPDPQHAVLEIARLDGKTTDLSMELGTAGWQIAVDAGAAKKIGRYLLGATAPKH